MGSCRQILYVWADSRLRSYLTDMLLDVGRLNRCLLVRRVVHRDRLGQDGSLWGHWLLNGGLRPRLPRPPESRGWFRLGKALTGRFILSRMSVWS